MDFKRMEEVVAVVAVFVALNLFVASVLLALIVSAAMSAWRSRYAEDLESMSEAALR
ncbi:MAG: hypothetical protein WD645_03520 [Dehalococcoidia bacterium]